MEECRRQDAARFEARVRLTTVQSMNELLARSTSFEEALQAILGPDGVELFDDSARHSASAGACLLSLEHASMVRQSFAAGAPHSGTALLRLQYEALLRGAWTLHAATDLQVGKMTAPLSTESEQMAKNLPGAQEMLAALSGKAPIGLTKPLQEFQAVSWKALNSFVHGGIHPLRRVTEGFPQQLGEQVVRNSNGLMHLGYRLLSSLSGSQDLMTRTTRIYGGFPDCLPMP